jgi:hypothetical protein
MSAGKVFERDERRAASFHITDNDLRAVEHVARYRLILGEQILQLNWPRPSQRRHAESRLRGLCHAGWLDRQPYVDGTLKPRAVYGLGRLGRQRVAESLGVSMSDLGPRPAKERAHDALFLKHHLLTVQFAINLSVASEHLGGSLLHYEDERPLKASHFRNRATMPVIPDAFAAVSVGTRTQSFCVELDRATVEHKKWRERVRGYWEWSRSAEFSQRYHRPTVLVVVAAEPRIATRRVSDLKRITEAASERDPSMFLFTTLEQATPAAILDQPIWFVGGQNSLYRLLPRA